MCKTILSIWITLLLNLPLLASEGVYFSIQLGSKVSDLKGFHQLEADSEAEFKKLTNLKYPDRSQLFRELLTDIFAWSSGGDFYHRREKNDLAVTEDQDSNVGITQVATFKELDSLERVRRAYSHYKELFNQRFQDSKLEEVRDDISKEALFIPKGLEQGHDEPDKDSTPPCLEEFSRHGRARVDFCVESVRLKVFSQRSKSIYGLLLHVVSYPRLIEIARPVTTQTNLKDTVILSPPPKESETLSSTPEEIGVPSSTPDSSETVLDFESNLACVPDIALQLAMQDAHRTGDDKSTLIPSSTVSPYLEELRSIFINNSQLPDLCIKPKLSLYLQLDYKELDIERLRLLNSKFSVSNLTLNPLYKYVNFTVEGGFAFHAIKREYEQIDGVILLNTRNGTQLSENPIQWRHEIDTYQVISRNEDHCKNPERGTCKWSFPSIHR